MRRKRFSIGAMSSLALLALNLLFSQNALSVGLSLSSIFPYVGSQNFERAVFFSSRVLLTSDAPPTLRQAKLRIDQQLKYLLGPLQWATQTTAAPNAHHSLKNIRWKPADGSKRLYEISYDYESVAVVPETSPDKIPVYLPLRPETIYEASMKGAKSSLNPCTSPNDQKDFEYFYFWSPMRDGCDLKEGSDYVRSVATLKAPVPARQSVPEYSRLVNSDGEITVSVFFGMDDPSGNGNPNISEDANAYVYRYVRSQLESMDFKAVSRPAGREPAPYTLEIFEKEDENAVIRVSLFFGSTEFKNPWTTAFTPLYKKALEQDSMVIYGGHSGLGSNMRPRDAKLDPARYQIFVLDSCSSYSYYNEEFFSRKATKLDPAGTHNLDIIANGLESDFADGNDRVETLVKALDDWATDGTVTSYQEILDKFSKASLPGVSGDEDNPLKPQSKEPPKL